MPAVADGHEAQREAQEAPDDRCRHRLNVQHVTGHHHGCAGERRERIEIGSQDGRYFTGKHVAQHAATDPGQHAKERRHDRVESVDQGFFGPGNGEESKAHGIEPQDRIAQPLNDGEPVKGQQAGENGDAEILPVRNGCRRYRQQISLGATASDRPGAQDHTPDRRAARGLTAAA